MQTERERSPSSKTVFLIAVLVWKPYFIYESNEVSSTFYLSLGICVGIVISTFCGAPLEFIVKGWIAVGLSVVDVIVNPQTREWLPKQKPLTFQTASKLDYASKYPALLCIGTRIRLRLIRYLSISGFSSACLPIILNLQFPVTVDDWRSPELQRTNRLAWTTSNRTIIKNPLQERVK